MTMRIHQLMISGLVFCIAVMQSFATETDKLSSERQLEQNSVYHLQAELENQFAENLGLNHYEGHTTLVTMFYASCPHVCPMLISTLKLTESKLSEKERAKIRVLAISIDPQRDTPEVLNKTLKDHSLDSQRWSLARSEVGQVRVLASVFGIKYKQLPSGEFNHSTRIVLLDGSGVEVGSTTELGQVDESFVQKIKSTLR